MPLSTFAMNALTWFEISLRAIATPTDIAAPTRPTPTARAAAPVVAVIVEVSFALREIE